MRGIQIEPTRYYLKDLKRADWTNLGENLHKQYAISARRVEGGKNLQNSKASCSFIRYYRVHIGIQYLIIKFLCFPQIGDVSKSLVSIKMSWMALENLGRLVRTSFMHNSHFKD